ncbi:MAG: hypothetical protein RL722_1848 [Pseudomonadota bacterium]|jgi:RimJ/RimL family protein N-acetyltransferase
MNSSRSEPSSLLIAPAAETSAPGVWLAPAASAQHATRLDAAELRRRAPAMLAGGRLVLEQIRLDHAPMLREAVLTSRAELGFIDWAQGLWDLERARRFCRKGAAAVADGGYLCYLAFELALPRPATAPSTTSPLAASRPPGLGERLLGVSSRPLRGRYVGLLDLHSFDWQVPRCQIGYVGDSAQRGKGLMREAALFLMQTAHGWGVHRIEAWCDARNLRSQHFAGVLGLSYEGRLRHASVDPQGRYCDELVYARVAEDAWPG